MPHLEHKRVFRECADEIVEPLAVFVGTAEAPRKLQQHSPKPVFIHQDVEAGANFRRFGAGPGDFSLVGESLPHFCRETKIRIVGNPPAP